MNGASEVGDPHPRRTIRNGASLLAEGLRAFGVDTVFGIPGTHNLAVYQALAEHRMRHVTMRHEQGCGYAADGYARTTGRVGVCLTTTGPGALNAITAAAQAYSDSVPVLFIASGLPTDHPSCRNGFLHEVKDQAGAMSAVLDLSRRVTSHRDLPTALQQCFVGMRSGRPRPAYLEIPTDLLEAECEPHSNLPNMEDVARTESLRTLRLPNPSAISRAADMIADSGPSVLLIAGGGSIDAGPSLEYFAETIDAPVLTTTNGKAAISEFHPLSIGVGAHRSGVHRIIREADLVIAVGTELAPTDWWDGPPQAAGRLIRIDVDAASICINGVPDVAVVGDAGVCLTTLAERLRTTGLNIGRRGTERAHRWRSRLSDDDRTQQYEAISAALNRWTHPSSPTRLILAADNSMVNYRHLASELRLAAARSYHFPTGLGTLGYAVPAAIGAKIGSPDSVVVAVAGDGGFLFTGTELSSAIDADAPIVVIVVDNGGYGEIRNEYLRRYGRSDSVDITPINFEDFGRSMHCAAALARTETEIAAELEAAVDRRVPPLILVKDPPEGPPPEE